LIYQKQPVLSLPTHNYLFGTPTPENEEILYLKILSKKMVLRKEGISLHLIFVLFPNYALYSIGN